MGCGSSVDDSSHILDLANAEKTRDDGTESDRGGRVSSSFMPSQIPMIIVTPPSIMAATQKSPKRKSPGRTSRKTNSGSQSSIREGAAAAAAAAETAAAEQEYQYGIEHASGAPFTTSAAATAASSSDAPPTTRPHSHSFSDSQHSSTKFIAIQSDDQAPTAPITVPATSSPSTTIRILEPIKSPIVPPHRINTTTPSADDIAASTIQPRKRTSSSSSRGGSGSVNVHEHTKPTHQQQHQQDINTNTNHVSPTIPPATTSRTSTDTKSLTPESASKGEFPHPLAPLTSGPSPPTIYTTIRTSAVITESSHHQQPQQKCLTNRHSSGVESTMSDSSFSTTTTSSSSHPTLTTTSSPIIHSTSITSTTVESTPTHTSSITNELDRGQSLPYNDRMGSLGRQESLGSPKLGSPKMTSIYTPSSRQTTTNVGDFSASATPMHGQMSLTHSIEHRDSLSQSMIGMSLPDTRRPSQTQPYSGLPPIADENISLLDFNVLTTKRMGSGSGVVAPAIPPSSSTSTTSTSIISPTTSSSAPHDSLHPTKSGLPPASQISSGESPSIKPRNSKGGGGVDRRKAGGDDAGDEDEDDEELFRFRKSEEHEKLQILEPDHSSFLLGTGEMEVQPRGRRKSAAPGDSNAAAAAAAATSASVAVAAPQQSSRMLIKLLPHNTSNTSNTSNVSSNTSTPVRTALQPSTTPPTLQPATVTVLPSSPPSHATNPSVSRTNSVDLDGVHFRSNSITGPLK